MSDKINKLKFVVLNGSSKAIALSVVVHLLLVYLLSSTISLSPHIAPSVNKPIDSYLYVPPSREEPEPELQIEELPEKKKEVPEKEKPAEVEQPDIEKEVASDTQETFEKQSQESTQHSDDSIDKNPPSATKSKSFSAASSFNQLRELNRDLDNAMFEEILTNRTKPNTGSVMHGKPKLVPHSVQAQSAEEKKKTATQQMGSGIAITKGDDGHCTITRDLSHVGMEGLTSVEGFSCGQTEMQKAFQEHMKKWKKKYGKLKNSTK